MSAVFAERCTNYANCPKRPNIHKMGTNRVFRGNRKFYIVNSGIHGTRYFPEYLYSGPIFNGIPGKPALNVYRYTGMNGIPVQTLDIRPSSKALDPDYLFSSRIQALHFLILEHRIQVV